MSRGRELVCVKLGVAFAIATPELTQPQFVPCEVEPILHSLHLINAGGGWDVAFLGERKEQLAAFTDDIGIHPLIW